jgi:acyl-coenzyme A thioesterase PaaI-like protein
MDRRVKPGDDGSLEGEPRSSPLQKMGFSMPASDTSDKPPQAEPALRAIAMPADANPHGDIFGGWLLSQMDLAGGAAARRRAKGRTVTVAITAMTFHRPVFVGDGELLRGNHQGRESLGHGEGRELGAARHRR